LVTCIQWTSSCYCYCLCIDAFGWTSFYTGLDMVQCPARPIYTVKAWCFFQCFL